MNNILFIVEGPTERMVIESLIRDYLKGYVTCEVVGTDITYNELYKGLGEELVLSYLKDVKNMLDVDIQAFSRIVLITDTDGCFISNDKIIGKDYGKIEYCDDCILAVDINHIKYRNKLKQDRINSLLACPDILGVPFYVYYDSCNFEHVLFNKRNIKSKKMRYAERIIKQYKNNESEFIKFIKSLCSSCVFDQSWEYIREDCNSLKRDTNFGFLFDEYGKNKYVNKMNIVKNKTSN